MDNNCRGNRDPKTQMCLWPLKGRFLVALPLMSRQFKNLSTSNVVVFCKFHCCLLTYHRYSKVEWVVGKILEPGNVGAMGTSKAGILLRSRCGSESL